MLYPNLVKAMKDEGVTKTDIANLLGLHFNTVTAKLEGETSSSKAVYQVGFTLIEAVMIKNIFLEDMILLGFLIFLNTQKQLNERNDINERIFISWQDDS